MAPGPTLADRSWVADALPADIDVVAIDLASHRRSEATRSEDVAQGAAAITDVTPPVVVMGWSRGGAVLTDLPAARLGVRRLPYVAAVAGVPPDDPAPPTPDAPAGRVVDHLVDCDHFFLFGEPRLLAASITGALAS